MLKIIDCIGELVATNQQLPVEKIITQVNSRPNADQTDPIIITYIHDLMLNRDKLATSYEDILEALSNDNALKRFKISNMQKNYFEKKGYSLDEIDAVLEKLEENAVKYHLASAELEKFIALLALIDWLRNELTDYPKEELLSPQQIAALINKLRNKLPDVCTILNQDIPEFDSMIEKLQRIINETINDIKNGIKYADMSPSLLEEQSLSQDLGILSELEKLYAARDITDAALACIKTNSKLSADDLMDAIKQTTDDYILDPCFVSEICDAIVCGKLHNRDDILAKLDRIKKEVSDNFNLICPDFASQYAINMAKK